MIKMLLLFVVTAVTSEKTDLESTMTEALKSALQSAAALESSLETEMDMAASRKADGPPPPPGPRCPWQGKVTEEDNLLQCGDKTFCSMVDKEGKLTTTNCCNDKKIICFNAEIRRSVAWSIRR